jgi:energy-converting hydrogenase B subunit D
MTYLMVICVAVMLGGALLVLFLRDAMAAVVASSVISLALSIAFVLLRAPDVALAEATVGAGLTGVVFALALRRVGWRRDAAAEDAPGGEHEGA